MSLAGAMYATAARKSACKPGKWFTFYRCFEAKMQVDSAILYPNAEISGQFKTDVPEYPLTCNGVRIQLEALCSLKFETKVDNRVRYHQKEDNLLVGVEPPNEDERYIKSPVLLDLLPEGGCYEIPSGSSTTSFCLQTTGENLPAPFKTSYGCLRYKLVAYMSKESQWVQVGEKILEFAGFHNLSENVDALRPAKIERSLKKSLFGSKIVWATLLLESCGYLRSESIPFSLCIVNPKCLQIKMSLRLRQQTVYNIDGAKKVTFAEIGSAMNEEVETKTEIVWSGKLRVHRAASPSYRENPMYSITHSLHFLVSVKDYGVLKGDTPIFIGTTREPVELLMLSAGNSAMRAGRVPRGSRRRSTSSIMSDWSGISNVTLPPAYSQLSSRAPSLQTLPPPYSSVCDDDFQNANNEEWNSTDMEFFVADSLSEGKADDGK